MLNWLKRKASSTPATGSVPVADIAQVLADADQLREAGHRERALDAYRQAHQLDAGRVSPLYWLATLHEEAGEFERARDYASRALLLDPDQIGLLLRMGGIAAAMRDHAAARDTYHRVARLDPDAPGIDALLADQLCIVGQLNEGIAAFDRALQRQPDSVQLQQARLFCLNYTDLLSPQQLADEHRAWGARHGPELLAGLHSAMPATDHAKLRVGYVSPDFRDHAVAFFVAPLLEHHDRSRFEVFAFDTSAVAEDSTTERMKAHVHEWRHVHDLDDAALAAAIRAAGIQILVDLSGHTKGNRLLMFARKPAPVQVTWLGYLSTTGLTAMDYRLTDAHMDPPGLTESLHTEELVRLPVQACFAPWPDAPPVAPSPISQGAPLTFGSVNQWSKVSDATKDLWASILVECQDARLHAIVRGGQNPGLQHAIAAEFAQRGVTSGQVEVFPFLTTTSFLQVLGRIDVALDPFPYGGGTTTMQCLWMGVPVVTLAGATALSRNSVGPLVCAGLRELVAATPAEYQATAIRLGRDPQTLARLRTELRPRLRSSALTDATAFAHSVEEAYRGMWDRYISAQTRA